MKVIVVEPGQTPEVKEINPGCETLQQIVGGYFEVLYPFHDSAALICNEEGKLLGLAPNRALYSDDGEVLDVIMGTFIIVDSKTEDFGSLSDEQVGRYTDMFMSPEAFVLTGDKVMVLPLNN